MIVSNQCRWMSRAENRRRNGWREGLLSASTTCKGFGAGAVTRWFRAPIVGRAPAAPARFNAPPADPEKRLKPTTAVGRRPTRRPRRGVSRSRPRRQARGSSPTSASSPVSSFATQHDGAVAVPSRLPPGARGSGSANHMTVPQTVLQKVPKIAVSANYTRGTRQFLPGPGGSGRPLSQRTAGMPTIRKAKG